MKINQINTECIEIYNHLPVPTIIINSEGKILLTNRAAIKFLAIKESETLASEIYINEFLISDSSGTNAGIENIIKLEGKQKTLIRLNDGKIKCIDINASTMHMNTNLLQIQFTESNEVTQSRLLDLHQAFSKEVLKLRPYLNKPGKELLETLLFNEISTGIEKNKLDKRSQLELASNKKTDKIARHFPQLNENEIILSAFISQNLTIDEIALITGKTSNCLRVSFHRLIKKTEFKTSKEFLKKLRSIT